MAALYQCKLVKNGYVQELFYRDGKSEADVLESLQMFCWPDGEWTITLEREND